MSKRATDADIDPFKQSKISVYTKLTLYIAIALVTSIMTELSHIQGSSDTMDIIDWTIIWCKIALPGLLTWRAFIDKSISRLGPNS